jgi:acyl-CoA synthetase (NDP forming)
VLLKSQVPLFRSARNCLTAVKAYFDYHAFKKRYVSPFEKVPTKPSAAAKAAKPILMTGVNLTEHTSKEVLKAYGIPVSKDILCSTAAEAVKAAKAIGFPVVMKAISPDVLHKSDRGLVKLGVATSQAVRAAFADLVENVGKSKLDGVLVSEMITGGVETVVGVVQDDLFGPAVMFGLGGVAVEVYRDVTFRVPPFDRDEAGRMIEEIRALPLLKGARGKPKADIGALVSTIMKVQRLALDLSNDIAELDINPLVALPKGCVALDALIVTR